MGDIVYGDFEWDEAKARFNLHAHGVSFLEAPLPLDDVEGHARLATHGIPLGVGDLGLTHVDEFIDMMDRGRASGASAAPR